MFVTRARFEDAERICDVFRSQVAQLERANVILLESLESAREDVREQRGYNRTLVQQIVEMRREGFTKPDAAPTMAPRAPDPVSDAINVIAGNNIRERTRLGRVVSLWRAKGRDTDEIVHELLNPAPDEDGVSA